MSLRKIVFWSHLVVGVSAGLVVFVLAVTGALLAFEVQITRWADPRVAVDAQAARLTADVLAEAALLETGGAARALVFENAPDAPVAATFGRGGRVLLDPYSGAALGDGETPVKRVFAAVTSLHRWLSFTGMSETGKAVTGVANLGFLFLALSGAYLWLPKVWRWARVKYLILFRRTYPSAQARDYHWHHVLAFWSLVPLVVVIATGVTMSYERAEGLVMTLVGVGDEAEDQRPGTVENAPGATGDGVTLEAVLAVAMAHDPAWNRVTLELPQETGASATVATVDTGPGRQPTRQERLTIALADGGVVAVEPYADQPKAARTFLFLRFGHTGEFFGVVGQAVAGLASLAAAVMVYTGLALAWRRLVTPRLRQRRRSAGA